MALINPDVLRRILGDDLAKQTFFNIDPAKPQNILITGNKITTSAADRGIEMRPNWWHDDMPPSSRRPWSDHEKLACRLNKREGDEILPCKFHIIRGLNKVTLVLAMDAGDRVVLIEDDPNLFPSDAVLAKLHMLLG